MFTVAIRSGTSGWFNHDGCDKVVDEICGDIPRIGEIIKIIKKEENKSFKTETKEYMVKEVERTYNRVHRESYIRVYVIEIAK